MPSGERTPSLKKVAASMTGTEINDVLSAGISSYHKGFAVYPDTAEGLAAFRRDSESYLAHCRDQNEAAALGLASPVVPDIESWASYLGTTRRTIARYEKGRDEEWKQAISAVKEIITACKKQLAFVGKMSPVLAIFDLTNNSDYVNSSEFRLSAEAAPEAKQITAEEWEKVIDAEPEAPKLSDFKLSDDLN
jgi:hypothetical protein